MNNTKNDFELGHFFLVCFLVISFPIVGLPVLLFYILGFFSDFFKVIISFIPLLWSLIVLIWEIAKFPFLFLGTLFGVYTPPEDSKESEKEIKEERKRRVSSSVKREVWRRDKGRCVNCGSRENLEYDHIIPFSKGGSNTARNIELLCEQCNRSKGAKIDG